MSKILIKNAKAIVTCNEKDEVFYDADLLIDGPKIVAIGKDLKAEEAEVIDGKGKFVYPGMVNTHHHFFQTFVRNLITIDYPHLTINIVTQLLRGKVQWTDRWKQQRNLESVTMRDVGGIHFRGKKEVLFRQRW